MDIKLTQAFKELRNYIESSSMTPDEQIRAKVMLKDIECNASRDINETDKEIDRQVTEKVEDMRKSFTKSYTKLANEYMSLEKHKDDLVQQIVELNSKCGQLEKQVIEKDSMTKVEAVSEKDKVILSHIDKVKEGNISFKDDLDTNLMIELYKQGNSAGKIMKTLNDNGYEVARQTVVNRLTRIGLWGNRENWSVDKLTDEQIEYINRHGINIKK